jgi:hypothetical protein
MQFKQAPYTQYLATSTREFIACVVLIAIVHGTHGNDRKLTGSLFTYFRQCLQL